MNKNLRLFSMFLMCMMVMFASAQSTITLGYCNNEITSDDYRVPSTGSYSVMAAVRIPASQLAALKGARITKLRIGVEAGVSQTYAWVRSSLNGTALAIRRVGTTTEGWNEVELATPYVITGEDIYLGMTGTFSRGKSLIFNGTNNPNGAYVSVGGSWEDRSSEVEGSLCIQGIVETDGDVQLNDLGLERLTIDNQFAANGDVRTIGVNISNYGLDEAAMPTMHYQLDGGAVTDVAIDDNSPIAPSASRKVSFELPIDGLQEGIRTLKLWIDSDDSYADNNTVNQDVYVYSTTYPRTMLLEQFTTIPCTFCPRGQALLEELTKNVSGVVWVAHHAGFNTDQFTISASEDLLSFGVTSAPRAMFDRRMVACSENKPAFGIGYDLSEGLLRTQGAFNDERQSPAFAFVGIESDYDASTRQLSFTVSGERSQLCSEIYPNSNLTVYLVEDSLVSNRPQTGGTPADTIHNNVVREALTESLGTPIVWNGNNFEEQFSVSLPEEYKVKNLKIVAFINRSLENDDYTNANVLNATQLCVATQTTGIDNAVVDGEVTTRSFYNLQGQRLDAQPTRGIYIERMDTLQGVKVMKRIAK